MNEMPGGRGSGLVGRMAIKAVVVAVLLVAGSTGCAAPRGEASGESKACEGATYEWSHEARWVPIVLDQMHTVSRGDELKVEGRPYSPWSSSIDLAQDMSSPDGVLRELSRKLGKPLAEFGKKTESEVIKMTTEFEGDEAQAVYFQAVKRVDAKFTLKCSGRDRMITGKISTWDKSSNSFGTADCLKPLADNPENPVVKVAAVERCPKGSVLAREVLGLKS
ncbi:hypothetical protein [Streptomyces cinereoruber]|uniref:hypothetical protein n=1 Tax=Streptomyces cinereoruber TaxID=67260 RepID=UPI0036325A8B